MIKEILNQISEKLPENNRFERIWKIAQVDFKKRYYNDRLGLFWAFLNPVMQVLVYWAVFTFLMKRVSEDIPNFGLFLFSALICWMFFKEVSKKSMKVLKQKKYLIENIKVDKIDLFLSNGISSLIGFYFNIFAYGVVALLLFNTSFSLNLLYLPILICNLFLMGMGFGMILSTIYIYARDIDHLLDIFFLLVMWTSGVFFPAERVIEFWRPMFYINPFLGIFKNIRAVLVYDSTINIQIMSLNFSVGLLVFILGIHVVNKYTHKALEYL